MKDIFKNHWIWLVTTIVGCILAWGQMKFTVDVHSKSLEAHDIRIQDLSNLAIRQEAVNKTVESMDKKIDRLISRR